MSNFKTHLIIFFILIVSAPIIFLAFYNKSNSNVFVPISEQYFESKDSVLSIEDESSFLFSIFVISDTHLNSSAFPFLMDNLSLYKPDIIFHIGDHSDYGDPDSLLKAKNLLDSLNVKFYALPGDRDIAFSSDDKVFSSVFGKNYSPYSIIDVKGIKFFIFPNMYNFTPFDTPMLPTIQDSILGSNVVISSQPIYIYPDSIFSNKYMGSEYYLNRESVQSEEIKKYVFQSNQIRDFISSLQSQKLFIAGDHHKSDNYTHPSNSFLKFHITGALAEHIESGSLKLKQSALQSQRFSLIRFYKKDNETSYVIKEIEIPLENTK